MSTRSLSASSFPATLTIASTKKSCAPVKCNTSLVVLDVLLVCVLLSRLPPDLAVVLAIRPNNTLRRVLNPPRPMAALAPVSRRLPVAFAPVQMLLSLDLSAVDGVVRASPCSADRQKEGPMARPAPDIAGWVEQGAVGHKSFAEWNRLPLVALELEFDTYT